MSAAVTGSAPAGRSAAFLEEIGVGPLWRLRRPATPQDGGDSAEEGAGLRPAAAFIAAPREHAQAAPDAVLAEPVGAVAAPSSAPHDAAPAAHTGVPVTVPATRVQSPTVPDTAAETAPSPSPAARITQPDDDTTARFGEPSPFAPRVSPADDGSSARFDASSTSAPRVAPMDDGSSARFDPSSISAPRVAPADDGSSARFDESSISAPRVAPMDDDSSARFDASSPSAPRVGPADDGSSARFGEPSTSAPRVGPADDGSSARFDASSISAPRVAPMDDDSTAWFDDAPAPPAPVPVSAEAIARMDWDQLKTAAAKCTRCALSRTRRAVVFGRGDARATLMVLASAPGRADEREGVAIGGEAGVLLENMLRAAGFAGAGASSDYYVSHLVKCRPSGGEGAERAPAPEELAACRPYLQRELVLTGARTVLTLGHPALRGLLGAGVPAARGAVQHIDADARSVAVVATYHPADLLRQGENKAGAWADLCLARQTHGAAPA